MNYPVKLESLLNQSGLPKPSYRYHKFHYEGKCYYECMIEHSDLFIQESCIKASASIAQEKAAELLLNKIVELKLLPSKHKAA